MAYGQYTADKPKDLPLLLLLGPEEKKVYARWLLLSAKAGECKQ